ncbi:MAG: dockerin type I domain-containing protein [Pirellulales bacterium]
MKNRSHSQRTGRTRRAQLGLERLELRRLFAGLNVFVYSDQDGSRRFDAAAEQGAANRVVYVDLNGNAKFDADDLSAVTDAAGHAQFPSLVAGSYQVGLLNSNAAQVQSSYVEPAIAVRPQNAVVASNINGSADLSGVWTVSNDGAVTNVAAGASSTDAFDLGGSYIASAQSPLARQAGQVGQTWALIDVRGSGRKVVEVDFAARTARPVSIAGLPDGSQLDNLVVASGKLRLQVSGPRGSALLTLATSESGLSVSDSADIPAGKLYGTPGADYVFVLSTGATGSRITQLHLGDTSVVSQASRFTAAMNSLALSADGRLLFAVRSSGGIEVYRTDGTQTQVAELAEAAGPIATGSSDGRIVTTNRGQSNELIAWDTATWLPVGRTTLSGTDAFGRRASVFGLKSDSFGNALLAATSAGVYRVDLAVPSLADVVVSTDRTPQIDIGVRVIEQPSSNPGDQNVDVNGLEDTLLTASLRDLAAGPLRSAVLFQQQSIPLHGRVQIAANGQLTYTPHADFFGSDSFVVEVLDGLTTSIMTVSLNVAPVNDAPRSLQVSMAPVSEVTSAGSIVGRLHVDDPDLDQDYQVVSSDPRFIVVGDTIMRTSDGTLDYETEPRIPVVFTAYRPSEASDSISTTTYVQLIDFNEPPLAITVDASKIKENVKGAIVGPIAIVDPDGHGEYQFNLSDARFEIVDGELKLRDDVSLDYESEPQVNLLVTVNDPSAGSGYDPATGLFNIDVEDVDEQFSGQWFQVVASDLVVRAPGEAVGTFQIVGGEASAIYTMMVSDSRFRFQDKTLYAKSDAKFDSRSEPSISLSITATDDKGRSVSPQFTARVTAQPEFQNPSNPLDVDNDGGVYPRDVLILINEINQRGPRPAQAPGSGESGPSDAPPYPDVNGDGYISPIDILIIINYLNGPQSIAPEGEAFVESTGAVKPTDRLDIHETDGPACAPFITITSDEDTDNSLDRIWTDQNEKWNIDTELEQLLSELSFARRSV